MATYLSLDKKRDRWIFQIRIPSYASAAFDGRTTIRKHIGSMCEAEAQTRATQFTAHYKSLFRKIKDSSKGISASGQIPVQGSDSKVIFLLDKDIGERFIATWRMLQCDQFQKKLTSLRGLADQAWDDFELEITESIADVRDRLRRQHTDLFKQAFEHIQNTLNIQIEGTPDALESLITDFNAATLSLLEDYLKVIQGNVSINALFPDRCSQLPLVELWGNAASQLAETWKDRVINVGGRINLKTYDKYQGIAMDLSLVMKRRPLQSLREEDLYALLTYWRSRGNKAPTVKGKLSILKTLLRPFDIDNSLCALINNLHKIKRNAHTARLPFTEQQLHTFIKKVFGSCSVREDDKMLLMLQLLLATRIEEAYQLRAEDFELMDGGWHVRFVDSRQSGHGQSRLKTPESARRLPLHKGVFPALDIWLQQRIEVGGYIFPEGSSNKYAIRSSAASKRLNKILRDVFPHDTRLVLQSTRKTANTIMRRGGTDTRVRHRFLGHADEGIHEIHYDPGELLDAADLESGSLTIAKYIKKLSGSDIEKPAGADIN